MTSSSTQLSGERFSVEFVAETDLTETQDESLRQLLALAFPDRSSHFAKQSWWLARPQWRLWLSLEGVAVAHLGMERRRIGVGDADVVVVGVGHVCTDPRRRGERLGALLMAALAGRIPEPTALLTCSPQVEPFYAATGWSAAPGPVIIPNTFTGEDVVDSEHTVMTFGSVPLPTGRPIELRGLAW